MFKHHPWRMFSKKSLLSQPPEAEAAVFLGNIEKRCRDEVEPLPSIYEEEISRLRGDTWNDDMRETVSKIPTFDGCRGGLYYQRSKSLPVLPQTRDEIDLPEDFKITTANEEFLLADDGDNDRILLFSTNDNLTHLAAAET
ncbi:hypothetical protein KUTeg_024853 [Tegillarca granosa]|uniref:Uncharacterized protein n=1 Tax=Tegillarca granosa TaxID=220873 RepID=A0ABQ9E379_TEGGR|nr:hypothetical protein KUTeg_024853 [Tegillarca granosa]